MNSNTRREIGVCGLFETGEVFWKRSLTVIVVPKCIWEDAKVLTVLLNIK